MDWINFEATASSKKINKSLTRTIILRINLLRTRKNKITFQ